MKNNFLYTFAGFYAMAISFVIGILIKKIVLPEIVGAFAFVVSLALIMDLPGSILRNGLERLVPRYRGMGDSKKTNEIASLSLLFLLVFVFIGALLLSAIGFFFSNDLWQFWAFPTYSLFFIINSITAFFLSI